MFVKSIIHIVNCSAQDSTLRSFTELQDDEDSTEQPVFGAKMDRTRVDAEDADAQSEDTEIEQTTELSTDSTRLPLKPKKRIKITEDDTLAYLERPRWGTWEK